jgi:hypothetical protein
MLRRLFAAALLAVALLPSPILTAHRKPPTTAASSALATFDTEAAWNSSILLSGHSNLPSRVAASVERLTKELVVDWSSANPS